MTARQDFMTEAYASRLADARQVSESIKELEEQQTMLQDRLRAMVRQAHSDGVPVAVIARHCGISRQTAHRWVTRP